MDNFDSSYDDGTSTALADGNSMTNAMLAENTKKIFNKKYEVFKAY